MVVHIDANTIVRGACGLCRMACSLRSHFAQELMLPSKKMRVRGEMSATRFVINGSDVAVAAAVVRAAAAAADGTRARPAGRALGLSFNVLAEGMAAEVAEIPLGRERGLIRVHAVWIAIDAGSIVNPESVTAQMQGVTIMGLGPALYEQVRVRNGELQALIAPAVANAFARLTGKRLRSLPMSPAQVLQALHA
jgi:CO/xanthine dehydrogenase Mo-binding subunit